MTAIIPNVYNPRAAFVSHLARIFRSSGRWARPTFLRIWDDYFEGFPVNGKRVYREHYDTIRRLVPEDNLLDYRVQEGWEPLCKFLGQRIPHTAFPMGNETAETTAKIKALVMYEMKKAVRNLLMISGGVLVLLALHAFLYYRQQ